MAEEDEVDEVDDSVFNLDISDKFSAETICANLRASGSSVESACFSRKFPSVRRSIATDKDVAEVLQAIVALPKIKHLKISYASGTFPIHLLLEALCGCENRNGRPSTLETLFFLGAKIAYSHAVLAANILEKNRSVSLPSVSLENCLSESLTSRLASMGRQKPMDILLLSLTKCEGLTSLSLSSFHKFFLKEYPSFGWLRNLHVSRVVICEESLRRLCHSPRLEVLHIDSLLNPPPERLMTVLGESLNTSTRFTLDQQPINRSINLHTLRLAYTPGRHSVEETQGYHEFWKMLQCNTTLKNLHFLVKGKLPIGDDPTHDFGIPIARALQHNTFLERLSVSTRLDITSAGTGGDRESLEQNLEAIARAILHSNETLQHFSLHIMGGLQGYSTECVHKILTDPFCRKNRSDDDDDDEPEHYYKRLETLCLEYRNQGSRPLTTQIQFQLDLNRAGRHGLLSGNPSRLDWIEALLTHREEPSIVFYFLSRNPSLLLRRQ